MNTEKSEENYSKKKSGESATPWRAETKALHSGWHAEKAGDPVTAPWQPSTVYRHGEAGLSKDTWSYTRLDNPNRAQLEQTLTSIEGGLSAVTFASGMAAVQAVFQCLSPGDHVLLPDDLYHGVRNLALHQFERWGLSFDFVDMTSLKEVESASKENTRMLWIETPSNPMLRISDMAALSALAKKRGWLTVADNTWATPVMQRPLDFDIGMVLYSSTKYLGGHSDILGGAVVVGAEAQAFEKPLRTLQIQGGAVPSAFDCWMMMRSLKTLYARVRLQAENAAILAERLEKHPAVKKVYYPGLKSHDGSELSARQAIFPGAMISFEVLGGKKEALAVVNASRLIQPATSLGGVESLWEHRKTSEYPESPTPDNLIRLSVGIEHHEDLWSDIENALKYAGI
ncbi:PLP-dependent aspartate aminotransferase family protein [Balneolaceae bacterium ANBcel3]|nr:PLP-dependent aspartate aminotransferase family protein [Balneolaceae bacterium ANBcel3]